MEEWYAYREGVQKSPAKKSQVLTRSIFSRTVKSQRHTRGTFMSAFSSESFSRVPLRLYPLVLLRRN